MRKVRTGVCGFEGCGKVGKLEVGFCSKHYNRLWRHGDPAKLSGRRDPKIQPGMVFGKWTIVSAHRTSTRRVERQWVRRCECGTENIVGETTLLLTNASKSCGCARPPAPLKNDLTGRRFERWLVVSRLGREPATTNRDVMWQCRCDCGVERAVKSYSLLSGVSTSCGCFQRECAALLGGRNMSKPGKAAQRDVFVQYRKGARNRQLEFSLTYEDFCALLGRACYYCGDERGHTYQSAKASGPFVGNGVDRKDNGGGYTIENCVPCCKRCNLTKRAMSADDFISMCRAVALQHTGRLAATT